MLRIIATVDEGHHLNVLEKIDIGCVPQPTAYIFTKEQAREKVLINLFTQLMGTNRKHLLLGQNRINIMKKNNAYSYKLAIAATSLVMVYFASGIASIAQATELLKAEPVQEINLIQEAQNNLKLSFSTLAINNDASEENVETMMAKQKTTANDIQPITLTKVSLISE